MSFAHPKRQTINQKKQTSTLIRKIKLARHFVKSKQTKIIKKNQYQYNEFVKINIQILACHQPKIITQYDKCQMLTNLFKFQFQFFIYKLTFDINYIINYLRKTKIQMKNQNKLSLQSNENQAFKQLNSNRTFQHQSNCQSSWSFQLENSINNSKKKLKQTKKVKDSLHHNAIKHAINTIKALINLNQFYKIQNDQILYLAKKLWEEFCKSKNFNKSILRMVYFTIYLPNDTNEEIKLDLEDYFYSIKIKYSKADIRKAQQLLIDITIESINKESIERHLKNRKILDKQSFKIYLLNIIEQLKNGNISIRLNSKKSKKMSEYQEINKYLDL